MNNYKVGDRVEAIDEVVIGVIRGMERSEPFLAPEGGQGEA